MILKHKGRRRGRVHPGYYIFVTLVYLLILSFDKAQAQDRAGPILTLDEAVRASVAWHPSVTEAIGRLKAQAQQIDVAEAGYKPQISAGLGTGYDNIGSNRWRPRANISASQMLFDFGKVSSSVAIAEAGTRITRAQLLFAVDSLIRDTSYALIEIQRGAALHEVVTQQLDRIRGISNLVDQRFERGATTRSDALQARARVQSGEALLQQIEAEQRRWDSNLAYLTGTEGGFIITPDMPPWFDGSCQRGEPDWRDVPAIMQVKAERDRAEAELDQNRADGLPTVSLGAGTSADVTDPISRRAEYNFGINVSSALYSGGANRARVRGASFAVAAAESAEANVRNEVGRRLSEAQKQVLSFMGVVETLTAREASMKQTGELYRLQYLEMGTRTLVDLLNAEQELQQVRIDLVNTRHDLRRLNVDCLFNAGSEREAFKLTGMVVQGMRL